MHFSLATIIAVVPLLASATPLAYSPRTTIPISKRANLHRDDGSVDTEALKASVAASTAYVMSLLGRLIHDLTLSVVICVVTLIRINRTLANANRTNPTTTSAPSVQFLSPRLKSIIGMVRISELPKQIFVL